MTETFLTVKLRPSDLRAMLNGELTLHAQHIAMLALDEYEAQGRLRCDAHKIYKPCPHCGSVKTSEAP